jgi:hypothetical protein
MRFIILAKAQRKRGRWSRKMAKRKSKSEEIKKGKI